MAPAPLASIEAWTDYWRHGHAASCFDGADAEVDLAAGWDQVADGLAEGARVLDLATGNGTVALRLAARARHRGIRIDITAIDAALIDPAASLADPRGLLRDVRFRGDTRMEELPFADASFDAVVSQFGFEYGDEARAAAEVVRVLAPGGRLRLVLHAHHGAVERDVSIRVERLRGVLADAAPLAALRRRAEAWAADAAAPEAADAALLAAIAADVRALEPRAPSGDAALFYLRGIGKLWADRERYDRKELLQAIEAGLRTAGGVLQRQLDMLRAARSEAEVVALASRLAEAGLSAGAPTPVLGNGGLQLAWCLDATASGMPAR